MSKQRISTRNMAVIAMFSAVSFVAVLISQIIPTVAGFLSYDPKDAIIVIAGFIMGPMASVAISVLVSFIEMITISTTGPYGSYRPAFQRGGAGHLHGHLELRSYPLLHGC